MKDNIVKLETYIVDMNSDTPYLGALRDGESINESGYFVKKGNKTVYPRQNRSIVVKLISENGIESWGETYGLVAPKATIALLQDLIWPFIKGQSPFEVEKIHDMLYGLMRVRGYTGGFYLDALAAIDIALWDMKGKILGLPLSSLLGGLQHEKISAYISGLPKNTIEQRCELALHWQNRGFHSFKFALPAADQGGVIEMKNLRQALGENAKVACDMHWTHTRYEALRMIQDMSDYKGWFFEAPVVTEDIDGLCYLAQQAKQTIAVGEEWRTVHDAKLRIDRQACHIIQPEMGHTGITQFMRIAQYAAAHHLKVIPHATIGSGIFLAASLQASATLPHLEAHEFQHSIFYPFQHFLEQQLECEAGYYEVANTPGIGAEPSTEMRQKMTLVSL